MLDRVVFAVVITIVWMCLVVLLIALSGLLSGDLHGY